MTSSVCSSPRISFIPYLYESPQGSRLFIIKGGIEAGDPFNTLYGNAERYEDFSWPKGIKKLSEAECRQIAGENSSLFMLLDSRLQEQFKKIFGHGKHETKMSRSLSSETLTLTSNQISEKKISLQTKFTQKKSLDCEINKKLFVDQACIKNINDKTNTLGITKLKCSVSLTDSELEYVVNQFPNLRYLDLGHCNYLTNTGISHLQNLHFLEHLDLCFCYDSSPPNITKAGFSYLANLPLKYLDLEGFENVADDTIALFKKCPLEYLCINRCQITDKGLSYLKHVPSLQILLMRDCERVTDEGLNVLKNLPLLEKLELHGCKKLSSNLQKYYRTKEEIEKFFLYLDDWEVV